MSPVSILLILGCAFLSTLIVTPLVIRLSRKLALVDSPDGHRKLQAKAVPLGGGLAVGVGVMATLAIALATAFVPQSSDWGPLLCGFVPAALILVVIGVVDDFHGMTGVYKLLGQFVAATVLAVGGDRFQLISLLGPEVNLGDFGILFAVFFTLGVINAFNLIDGSDALASSVGAIVCLTIGVLAWSQGATAASALAFASFGALGGFLVYNAPPAKVYLGDTGSMLIGLTVAYASIASSIKQSTAIAIAVPLALCALPILDTSAALLRRVLTGQSIFSADRGHFHHSLLLRGYTAGQTAALAALLTAVTCCGALWAHFTGLEVLALVSVLLVIGVLASFKVFGHAEFSLVTHQVAKRTRSVVRRVRRKASEEEMNCSSVHLQGSREWSFLWDAICEAAPDYSVCRLRLTVSAPGIHENFYATWSDQERSTRELSSAWKVTIPLDTHTNGIIGRLDAQGGLEEKDSYESLQRFLDYLEPFNDHIAAVIKSGHATEEAEATELAMV